MDFLKMRQLFQETWLHEWRGRSCWAAVDLKAQDPFYFSPSISDVSLCGERRWIHESEESEEAGSQRRQRRHAGPVGETGQEVRGKTCSSEEKGSHSCGAQMGQHRLGSKQQRHAAFVFNVMLILC